ncbi:MAG: HisA/HisF-related TIM barrel protein [Gammaproteobacteria bacterium]
MQIIPVIDLKDGIVVHARQGKRDSYRPIATELCRSPDVFDVLLAYLTLYDFPAFYISELNALSGTGNHDMLIQKVARHFSDKDFWLDKGYRYKAAHEIRSDNLRPVLGSESCREETLQSINSFGDAFVLSLDFLSSKSLGAESLFSNPALWPNDIIIMTLDRVGSDLGPDLAKIRSFCLNYPGKNFIAAGGIRNRQDLIALEKIGIKQALVASALHSGAIKSRDLAELQTKKYPG